MLAVARALEEGRLEGPLARAASRAVGRALVRFLVRPLPRPEGLGVVAVGGSTLGGSGKTPLAIACARELAIAGARVALVGHAYRARPGSARLVERGDCVATVGDEALVAALELHDCGVPVVVAPTRAQAVAHAALRADIVVVDGVTQTLPRADLALLAVDAMQPWGAGSVPPSGDLRAPVEALLSVTDRVVSVGADENRHGARIASDGVRVGGTLVRWEQLRGLRTGLVVAIARPRRLLSMLASKGVSPSVVVRSRDHAAPPADALRSRPAVDLWIASRKCALHLPALGTPLGVVDYRLVLGSGVREAILALTTA